MAQRVPSSYLCLGMAQSYRELKLHITTPPSTSLIFATALQTLRAMPELPVTGFDVLTNSRLPFQPGNSQNSLCSPDLLLGCLPLSSSDNSEPYVKLQPPAMNLVLLIVL